jgi:hypothetical protein
MVLASSLPVFFDLPAIFFPVSYFPPSFSKNKQMVSIPWWKFGM